ncbi:probable methyltransferase PMT11 [Nymphaea colorata]|nr:probable methyltransferase PMT11 [Nymphaea colorata]
MQNTRIRAVSRTGRVDLRHHPLPTEVEPLESDDPGGKMKDGTVRRCEYLAVFFFGIGCFFLGTYWKSLEFHVPFALIGNSQDAGFSIQNDTERVVGQFFQEFRSLSVSGESGGARIELCPLHMENYVPCRDDFDRIRSVLLPGRGRRPGRYCPDESDMWFCLIPAPRSYRQPVPWPESLNEVWIGNFPQPELIRHAVSKKLFASKGEKIKRLQNGKEHFLLQFFHKLAETVPDAKLGVRIKAALEIEAGFSGVGAALLSHNVNNLFIASGDEHKNQVQFALERGIPAMLADFGSDRLPYPSQAFDLIYCLECNIDWERDGGILLLEANRMLRAGGYFVLGVELPLRERNFWTDMNNITERICWSLVEKQENIRFWKKPFNNICYTSRGAGAQPPLCDALDNQDDVWYVKLKNCITPLPQHAVITSPLKQLTSYFSVPNRLNDVEIETHLSKSMTFKAEASYWRMVVNGYLSHLGWKDFKFQNVMDMRAGFGGFAAALYQTGMKCWVMNVVPISGPNTLPVIYDQGFIGAIHDWCEPFDTYPRTYDLIHAAGVFSAENKRCEKIVILIEMDRILRPGGRAYIRDSRSILAEVEVLAKLVGWKAVMVKTHEGIYGDSMVLICQKFFLHL